MIFNKVDLKIFLPVAFLLILGTVILSSVSPTSFPQHFFHIGLALFVFFFFANLDVQVLRELAPWFYILSLFLLSITLLLGVTARGSVRWIDLGPINVQSSEIVKPLLVVFFAWLVTREKENKKFLIAVAALLPAALLILVQPDLGSAVVLVAGFLGVVFAAGIPLRLLSLGSVLAVVLSPLAWGFLEDYQRQRIASFLAPSADPLGAGYNSIQAMIAVGSGRLSGKGLGQGTQSQLAFLPERHTDFIFAALSEELGFLGAFLILVAFALILVRIVLILSNTQEPFIRALSGGIFLVFFSQTAVNIGMNLGILPITGIPLPFVSAGGSSLVSMSAVLGIASSTSFSLKKAGYLGILRER